LTEVRTMPMAGNSEEIKKQIQAYIDLGVPHIIFSVTQLIEWMTSNIQYLYGFNWDLGKGTRDTLTFEHADAWWYGDNYFFLGLQSSRA
jgi:hypothetical protein